MKLKNPTKLLSKLKKYNPVSILYNKYLYFIAAILTIPNIASASEQGQTLKKIVGVSIAIVMLFAFAAAIVGVVHGWHECKEGNKNKGIWTIICSAGMGGSLLIVTIIWIAAGLTGSTTTASTDW